jgi:hypothetical protein
MCIAKVTGDRVGGQVVTAQRRQQEPAQSPSPHLHSSGIECPLLLVWAGDFAHQVSYRRNRTHLLRQRRYSTVAHQ